MPKPLVIDLFGGLGGWAHGFLAEGYRVVGFDNERHRYRKPVFDGKWCYGMAWEQYPGELVLQDVLTLHGSQFKDAAVIVASPPCQEFSYMAMPWMRGKQIAEALRTAGEFLSTDFPDGYTGSRSISDLNALFNACFRIQREACEAAGRHIPMVVENVKGAQPWVGQAKAHFGSFYLWGDVGMVGNRVVAGGLDFGRVVAPMGRTLKGRSNFHFYEQTGLPSPSFHGAAHEPSVQRAKASKEYRLTQSGTKNGNDWFGSGENCSAQRRASSKSDSRKAASAQIAKIPLPMAQYIARAFKPNAPRTGQPA